jgi:hypothetical protein
MPWVKYQRLFCCIIFYIVFFIWQSTIIWLHLILCTLFVFIHMSVGVLDTTLCDYVCQWLAADLWFSPGTLVTSTNKTDCHDIIEILLKVKSKYHMTTMAPFIFKWMVLAQRSNLILFGICCIIFYIVFFIWQSIIIWLHLILCTGSNIKGYYGKNGIYLPIYILLIDWCWTPTFKISDNSNGSAVSEEKI